jgi:phosphatase NudJ
LRVHLDGIFRVEHTPDENGTARCRFFLVAHAVEGEQLKTTPDEHAIDRQWVRLDELSRYPLRGSEVVEILRYVAEGGAVYPMDLLTWEGAPFPELKR